MKLEPLHIPQLLKRYNIEPKKSLGQNFLVDHNALMKIVRDSDVSQVDHVLEIGAGLGNLTRLLATQAASVTAVEIDQKLFPILEAVTKLFENVHLVHGDILELSPKQLAMVPGYKVIANIPYYITSAILRHLLEAEIKPATMTLTMQQAVAERILNQDDKLSLLSLSVQLYGEARINGHIPSTCFYPQPEVDSSLLIIDLYEQPRLSGEGIDCLFTLAHAAFNQKRKMLRNSLKPVFGENFCALAEDIEEAGIDLRRRPENLILPEWIQLAEVYLAHSKKT